MTRRLSLLLAAVAAAVLVCSACTAGAQDVGTTDAALLTYQQAVEVSAASHRALLQETDASPPSPASETDVPEPSPPSPPGPPKPPRPSPSPPKPPPGPPKPSPSPPKPPGPPSPSPRPPRPFPSPPRPSPSPSPSPPTPPSPPPVCTSTQNLVNGQCVNCPVCGDQYPQANGCPAWAMQAKNPCVSEYYYMTSLCNATCGFCKPGSVACSKCGPDQQLVNGACETCPDCVDTNPSCASWASYGYCNATWAATECKKTCGFCTGPDYTCDPCPTGQTRVNGVCTSTCPDCVDDSPDFCKIAVPVDGTYVFSNITNANITVTRSYTEWGVVSVKGTVVAGTLVNGPFGNATTVTGTLFLGTVGSGTVVNGAIVNGGVFNATLTDAVYGNGFIFNGIITNATITNGTFTGGLTNSTINGTLVNGTTSIFTKALGSQPVGDPGSSKVVTQSVSGSIVTGAFVSGTIRSAKIWNADLTRCTLANGTTLKNAVIINGTILSATFLDFRLPQKFLYATLVNATFLKSGQYIYANATVASGGNATYTEATIASGNITSLSLADGTYDSGSTVGACSIDATANMCRKSCGICSESKPCDTPTCPRNMKLVRGVCQSCHQCADGDGDYENGNSQYARDNCPTWAAQGNCLWNPWMAGNCKKSCGLCDPDNRCALLACKPNMQLHPEYQHGCRICRCKNNATNCDSLAAGADQPCKTSTYMLSNCPLACKTCNPVVPCLNICPEGMERLNPINGTCTPCAACVDNFPDANTGCPMWASRGDCMTSSYVKDNCVKSCTGCSGTFCRQRESPPPSPPPPPSPRSPPSPPANPGPRAPPRPPPTPPSPPAPSPPSQYLCCDIYTPSTCAQYAADGSCAWNPWMVDYCSQTCNLCTPTSPAQQCYCNDRWPYDCPKWTANGECAYNIYLRIYCRVSCNTCGVDI